MLNLIFTVLSKLARRRYVTAKEFQGKFMEYPIFFSHRLAFRRKCGRLPQIICRNNAAKFLQDEAERYLPDIACAKFAQEK